MNGKDGQAGGLVCKRCGCADFRVTHTERIAGAIRRRRTCRNCGHRVVTYENYVRPRRDSGPSDAASDSGGPGF